MNPWREIIFVVTIALSAVRLGRFCAAGNRIRQTMGYAIPLMILVALSLGRSGFFGSPEGWLGGIFHGRLRFVVLSFAIPVGILTLEPFLPKRWERIVVRILLLIFILSFSIFPFAAPVLVRNELLNTPNLTDQQGICLQTRPYTCGPAAAVTALHQLRLPAHEGQIAVSASTGPIIGTLPWDLCSALDQQYADQGLRCEFRRFNTLHELKSAGLTLVMVRGGPLTNHCVVVLAMNDRQVVVADPSLGKLNIPIEQFCEQWRYTGITLRRDNVSGI